MAKRMRSIARATETVLLLMVIMVNAVPNDEPQRPYAGPTMAPPSSPAGDPSTQSTQADLPPSISGLHPSELPSQSSPLTASIFEQKDGREDGWVGSQSARHPSSLPSIFPCRWIVMGVNVCFALDMSGSVCGNGGLCLNCPSACRNTSFSEGICCSNFNEMVDFSIAMVDGLPANAMFSVVQYAHSGTIVVGLTSPTLVMPVMQGLVYTGGYTNHGDAIALCQQTFSASSDPDRVSVILLVTDGIPNKPVPNPEAAAESAADSAKNNGTNIYTVFIKPKNQRDIDYVAGLSSDGECTDIPGFEKLPSKVEELATKIICETERVPSVSPSISPSGRPSIVPSESPSTSSVPSNQPSQIPSASDSPTSIPSEGPSVSGRPSEIPSWSPSISGVPSTQPSQTPSVSDWPASIPSEAPSVSGRPSTIPSESPSISGAPSSRPSEQPSISDWPTSIPSKTPSLSGRPSTIPSGSPSISDGPSSQPSGFPSVSGWPTSIPSKAPSVSGRPSTILSWSLSISGVPSGQPSEYPSVSDWPTSIPSEVPSISDRPSSIRSASLSISTNDPPSVSGRPSTVPSESPSISGAPSSKPSEVPSVTHWPTSIPSEAPPVTSLPSSTSTTLPSMSLRPSLLARYEFWYADLFSHTPSCLNDGKELDFMRATPAGWLFRSAEDCCKAHFSWNIVECRKASLGEPKWYPDFAGHGGCKNDGLQPLFMMRYDDYLFDTLEDCCSHYYSWNIYGCIDSAKDQDPCDYRYMDIYDENFKDADSEGGFYPNFDDPLSFCVNDGNVQAYMLAWPEAWRHDTLSQCCYANFQWMFRECMGSIHAFSDGDGPLVDTGAYSERNGSIVDAGGRAPLVACHDPPPLPGVWYVEYYPYSKDRTPVCVKECDGPWPCNGWTQSYKERYRSYEECCKAHLWWLDGISCRGDYGGL